MMITEQFLQFLWHKKLINSDNLKCNKGFPVEILDYGEWNHNQGPDFLFVKLKYQDIIFFGNVEIHVKSSDWISHHHDLDSNYQKIILHAVFYDDMTLNTIESKNIPTLVLSNYIDDQLLLRYHKISSDQHQYIPCEALIDNKLMPLFFHEENLIKKLADKRAETLQNLATFKNNIEAVFFSKLAYAFGLKINAEIFKQMAESIDFTIINKIRQSPTALEALFFGIAGWLDHPKDAQMIIWKREFDFLKSKFNLPNIIISPKFSKLRPPNFPTIRLSQLAQLYHQEPHLFSKIKSAKNYNELKSIFRIIKASSYWDNHYNFGKISADNIEKKLSSDFIDLIFLNAILPIKYTLDLDHSEDVHDLLLDFYKDIKPEKNHIIDQWKILGINPNNALETQSLLYHYQHFCLQKKCLNCGIGLKLLKKK